MNYPYPRLVMPSTAGVRLIRLLEQRASQYVKEKGYDILYGIIEFPFGYHKPPIGSTRIRQSEVDAFQGRIQAMIIVYFKRFPEEKKKELSDYLFHIVKKHVGMSALSRTEARAWSDWKKIRLHKFRTKKLKEFKESKK